MYLGNDRGASSQEPSKTRPISRQNQFGSMNPKLYTLLVIIGAVQVLLIGYWLIPRAVSLYFQTRGGQIVDRVLSGGEKTQWNSIACASSAVTKESTREILNKAKDDLIEAIRFSPEEAHPQLLLGRTYCLLGEPIEAVTAYKKYVELRPENPLGYLELGFAYEAACQQEMAAKLGDSVGRPEQQRCEIEEYKAPMIESWAAAGVTTQDFVDTGENARENGRHNDALAWFRRGSEYSPGDGALWFYIGQIYSSQDEVAISTEAFLTSIELGFTESINALVEMYTNIGDYNTLVAILGRALDHLPETPDIQEGSKIWDQIGRACQHTGFSADSLCARFIEQNQGNAFVDPDLSTPSIAIFWKRHQGLPGISYSMVECPDLQGRNCASITVNTPGSEFTGAGIYQCMLLEPGMEYKFSVWLKVNVHENGQYRKLYLGGTAGGRPAGFWATTDRSTGPLDWTFEEFRFRAPIWDGQACLHPIRLESEGSAWFYNPTVNLNLIEEFPAYSEIDEP